MKISHENRFMTSSIADNGLSSHESVQEKSNKIIGLTMILVQREA